MSEIDVVRWADAEDATEWHRSQVQGFFYRDDDAVKNDKKCGLLLCRDLTRNSGMQAFWQRDVSEADYDEFHKEMMHQIRLYRIGITASEYAEPTPKVEESADCSRHGNSLRETGREA